MDFTPTNLELRLFMTAENDGGVTPVIAAIHSHIFLASFAYVDDDYIWKTKDDDGDAVKVRTSCIFNGRQVSMFELIETEAVAADDSVNARTI